MVLYSIPKAVATPPAVDLVLEKRKATLMKFLTIIIQKQSPPPEMMPSLVEATIQWMAWAKGSGKI